MIPSDFVDPALLAAIGWAVLSLKRTRTSLEPKLERLSEACEGLTAACSALAASLKAVAEAQEYEEVAVSTLEHDGQLPFS